MSREIIREDRRAPREGTLGLLSVALPSLCTLLLGTVRLRLSGDDDLEELAILNEGNDKPAFWKSSTREIIVPTGASALALIDGVLYLIKDYRARRGKNHQGGATVIYGGVLRERLIREQTTVYDMHGGQILHLGPSCEQRRIKHTGIRVEYENTKPGV